MYDNFQEGEDNSNRLIVFATFNGLKRLCDSDIWFMDGTFGTAPKPFQQLFIIRVLEEKYPITCVYALLPSKDQSTYEETFTELKRIRIGDPTKKRNRRHTVTLQQRLKTLCEKLSSNEKSLPEFLHAVGHCIRF